MVRDHEAAVQLERATVKDVVRSAATPPAQLAIEGSIAGLPPGERRQVAISLANADGIVGLDLDLAFDSRALTIVDIQSTGIAAGYGVAHREADGKERIVVYGIAPLSGSGSVLLVTVEGNRSSGRVPSFSVSGTANEGAIPVKPSGPGRPSRTPRTSADREGSAR